AASGKLTLIDFDLISLGSDTIDLVQYANRILPFLSWSLKDLQKYPLLQKKMQEKAYLYSLAYPSDIFREWNRIIKDNTYMNSVQTQQVMELTMGQFYLREKFFKRLKRFLD
ncbi:MAG: aminoglycoside phosphotransferase, partial [Bacillota bacterium]|nr:aminoglycoside phosphotransferase [Bacillota bacterium]